MTARVLIVATQDVEAVKGAVHKLGWSPVVVDKPSRALEKLSSALPSIVIVDGTAPTFTARDLVAELKRNYTAPVLAITGLGDSEARRGLLEAGADDFVTAPVSELELTVRLRLVARVLQLSHRLQQATARLDRVATMDPLTSVHNMRSIRAHVRREYARSRRYERELAAMLCAVDGVMAARVGADPGAEDTSRVIEVAEVLRGSLRETDIVGREGEGFWVIAPETGAEGALALAERIRIRVADETPVTCCIGVSTASDSRVASGDDVLELASGAMLSARAAGRDRCVLA